MNNPEIVVLSTVFRCVHNEAVTIRAQDVGKAVLWSHWLYTVGDDGSKGQTQK